MARRFHADAESGVTACFAPELEAEGADSGTAVRAGQPPGFLIPWLCGVPFFVFPARGVMLTLGRLWAGGAAWPGDEHYPHALCGDMFGSGFNDMDRLRRIGRQLHGSGVDALVAVYNCALALMGARVIALEKATEFLPHDFVPRNFASTVRATDVNYLGVAWEPYMESMRARSEALCRRQQQPPAVIDLGRMEDAIGSLVHTSPPSLFVRLREWP